MKWTRRSADCIRSDAGYVVTKTAVSDGRALYTAWTPEFRMLWSDYATDAEKAKDACERDHQERRAQG